MNTKNIKCADKNTPEECELRFFFGPNGRVFSSFFFGLWSKFAFGLFFAFFTFFFGAFFLLGKVSTLVDGESVATSVIDVESVESFFDGSSFDGFLLERKDMVMVGVSSGDFAFLPFFSVSLPAAVVFFGESLPDAFDFF